LNQNFFSLLGRLSLVGFGILLALVVLEIGFRILYPDPSPKLINQGLQFNDTLGLAFTPGIEGWNTSLRGEYSTYVKINHKGLYVIHDIYHLNINANIGTCHVVIYGHTHRPLVEKQEGILYINPGSAGQPRLGYPPSVALLEIKGDAINASLIDLTR